MIEIVSEGEQKKPENRYWDNICDMQQKQTEKGFKKYGQVLEDNTGMTVEERIVYFQEELIDALMYMEHLKVKLKEGEHHE